MRAHPSTTSVRPDLRKAKSSTFLEALQKIGGAGGTSFSRREPTVSGGTVL